jgi:phospholipase C
MKKPWLRKILDSLQVASPRTSMRNRSLTFECLEERALPDASPLNQIDHFIVVYQENWSFDALYGSFPGANGLQNAAATIPQVNAAGTPLVYTPSPLNGGVVDPNFPSVIIGGKSYLAYPAIDANTGLADPNAGLPVPIGPYDLSIYIQPNQLTGDIVHKFYHEQLQIDNGNPAFASTDNGSMDKFVAVSDNPGLVMSHFDATNLPEGLLAQQYTMDDNFFHAAYGGSFLNHQFLVAAAAPEWNQAIPNANFSSHPAVDATKTDGAMNAAGHDSNLTGPDLVAADGNRFVVNTTFSANLVPSFSAPGANTLLKSINDSNPADSTRPFEANIGDSLSNAGVSWKWYSGGWDAAVNLQEAYASGNAAQIAAAKVPFAAGQPFNLFQWHHQPLAYYDNYSPLSPGGQAHLQDENNFFSDLSSGNLPAVTFIKPLGPDNEHPGYTNLLNGQQHVADIVHAVQNSPDWAHTAIIVTYDEHGGRWDHVNPTAANGPWGDGARVPGIVISPYAKQGYVDHATHDTLSILSTIEKRFNLAPLTQYDANASTLESSLQSTANADIGRAYLQPDADNVGKFALIVGGTESSDHISVTQDDTTHSITVTIDNGALDFSQSFDGGKISRIEVYGQGGNDHVEIASNVTTPAFVFSGGGNDHVEAGGGPSVVVGGQGNDHLNGGTGFSILIGGAGNDQLVASPAGSILIGGTTSFDANVKALKALLNEWDRTDETYQQKVDRITGNVASGKNGAYVLNASTVFDDGTPDDLDGNGSMSLFFGRVSGKKKDNMKNVASGAVVINI